MKVVRVRVENVKSIENSGEVELGLITLLVGKNNSGKSAFLQAVHSIQEGSRPYERLIRNGSPDYTVVLQVMRSEREHRRHQIPFEGENALVLFNCRSVNSNKLKVHQTNHILDSTVSSAYLKEDPAEMPSRTLERIGNSRKDALIIPIFNERRNTLTAGSMLENQENIISTNRPELKARLQNLNSRQDEPEYQEFSEACQKILHFHPSVRPRHESSFDIMRSTRDGELLWLNEMGAGVESVLHFLTELFFSGSKLFLIEEPETDLHPEALKELLRIISQKAKEKDHQFIISTHSNIVVTHLGAEETTNIVRVSSQLDDVTRLDNSSFTPINNNKVERINLLRELGYELLDYDLWDSYLILEESSAERIIRDYLIKWFVPDLRNRLRTIAGNGVDDVKSRFLDYCRLFTYLHLEEHYKKRAWVVVDGDEAGKKVIDEFHQNFKGWSEDHFSTFDRHNFEEYYPPNFQNEVTNLKGLTHDQKPPSKKDLLDKVITWIEENENEAKDAFEKSAQEVIDKLRLIEAVLKE